MSHPFAQIATSQMTKRFALAGALGGIGGFVVMTAFNLDRVTPDLSNYRRAASASFAAVVLLIGMALIVAERRRNRIPLITADDLPRLLAVAAIGAVSGFGAQILYESLLPELDLIECLTESTCLNWQVRLARTCGWGLAGLGTGAGVAVMLRERTRPSRTVLGGLYGGLVGGFLFDFVFEFVGEDNASWSRFVALTLIGALVGTAVAGMRQAWPLPTTSSSPSSASNSPSPGLGTKFPPPPPRPRQ